MKLYGTYNKATYLWIPGTILAHLMSLLNRTNDINDELSTDIILNIHMV